LRGRQVATTLDIMGSRLEHVIARNVTELRTEQGDTQPDLAGKMRAGGFTWQTNRVAQIETLRRPVSLLEVVGLSRVFDVPVSRLLAGEDLIDLPSGAAIPLAAVRAALAGERGTETQIRNMTPEESALHADSVDDLRKVAKGLGLDVRDLQALAYRLWGESFHSEREKRLADVSGLSKRSAQTKRGHVTRQLIKDVRTWIENNPDEMTPKALDAIRAESYNTIIKRGAVLMDWIEPPTVAAAVTKKGNKS